jgi:transmembrane sensor
METAPKLASAGDSAVEWHERLHRDKVPEDVQRAFERWLAVSPTNRQAYESVDRAWTALRGAAESPQILALRHETALRLTRRTSAHTRPWRWTVAAAAMIGVIAISLWVYPLDRPVIPSLLTSLRDTNHQRYQTATGERLAFGLSDGSQVTLDTQSELNIDFSPRERRVQLARGQAFFEVAKDSSRPFVVVTRDRQFVAVGTAFDVRLDADQVKITMVEGTVRVEPVPDQPVSPNAGAGHIVYKGPTSGDGAPGQSAAARGVAAIATITAGEQLISDSRHEDHVRGADPERDTSWRRGQLIFENERLETAIAEINRYSDVKIELENHSLGDLRLSGAFATGRPNVFVEAVTSYFPLRIGITDDKRIVLEKKN